ncbi:MAG: type I-E CRISPR-associated protein Cse1/CasA [Rhodobacteraceae bacterium]|nr:type I-E CRISPR-associated protein Cse1/CasA [Paracoccaceae bacterium]
MLNLISDPWIPMRRKDGTRAVIAPWQMADPALDFPDWPRPDLNIACLELLIGLVFMADPPANADDWDARQTPDPDRLRARLDAFAPAFELMGDGPRFMQDLDRLEQEGKGATPPDMLFIDSAGGQTARNNADLMVRRARYPALEPDLAAMAIYTLQAHAPSGGAGNRTSMRGGGPMVTLVDPGAGLWPLIWANTPDGAAATPADLPWMRPARTSEKAQQVFPHDVPALSAFFGMPRRLRLVGEGGVVTGVVQKPFGANYAGWEHPLTPHYRVKAGGELLPRHPRAGHFGYRNWLGVIAQRAGDGRDLARRAWVLDHWAERSDGRHAEVIVAGWSMDNMKPRDFIWSRAPLIDLPDDMAERMEGFVEAADALELALRRALTPVLAEGTGRDAAREAFFLRSQPAFETRLAQLTAVNADPVAVARGWLSDLRETALAIFDALALPGLAERDTKDQAEIVIARRNLGAAFAGYGPKTGALAYAKLGLPVPDAKRKRKEPA